MSTRDLDVIIKLCADQKYWLYTFKMAKDTIFCYMGEFWILSKYN